LPLGAIFYRYGAWWRSYIIIIESSLSIFATSDEDAMRMTLRDSLKPPLLKKE
jgi:hypothetical protein